MYCGTIILQVPHYYDKYLVGIGTVRSVRTVEAQLRHQYRCEACAHAYAFDGQADEPFYCLCGVLVALDAAPL